MQKKYFFSTEWIRIKRMIFLTNAVKKFTYFCLTQCSYMLLLFLSLNAKNKGALEILIPEVLCPPPPLQNPSSTV